MVSNVLCVLDKGYTLLQASTDAAFHALGPGSHLPFRHEPIDESWRESYPDRYNPLVSLAISPVDTGRHTSS